MSGELRRRLIGAVPEPTLRRLQRMRHGEHPSLHRPLGRAPHGVVPAIVTEYNAHAARAAVTAAVAAALDGSGVSYVLVPGPRRSVRQVAVSEEDRAAALRALDVALAGDGWVLEPRRGNRHAPTVLHAYRVLAAPSGALIAARENACSIGFWTRVTGTTRPRSDGDPHTPDTRIAPDDNQVVGYLSGAAWQRAVREPTHWPVADPPPDIFEVHEPIDLVYTWVDGSNPDWQRRKAAYHPAAGEHNVTATSMARFLSRDELRYSLRSVAMFAPWVRHIHIVTDGQVPDWLDATHPQISIVDHRDIFTDPSVLPVFNSHAIESQLHHVPDLAEHYLYLNDDFFFGRAVEPEVFFHGNGMAKFFLGRDILDLDPPTARDLPVVSAAKNQRALLERDFGITVRRKFRHTPQPQLRSVLEEMEKRYPQLFTQVAASRFRHPDDYSIPSALAHYYGYVIGRAVPADISYRYQDLRERDTARRLDEFLRQRPQVFCVNDIDTDESQLAAQEAVLREFFAAYYPLPSPYERTGDPSDQV